MGRMERFYEMVQSVTSCPEPERSSSIGTSKGASMRLEVEFFGGVDIESGNEEFIEERRELRSEKKSMGGIRKGKADNKESLRVS